MNTNQTGALNELALFAGAGGGILASKLLGWNTVGAVEIEDYPRQVLLQRQRDGILPEFPIWDDVRTFDGKPWRGLVDVVSGGFPCQDVSWAWNGKGIEGEKSGLWVEMHRVVKEVQPRYVLVENVGNLRKRGLEIVNRMLKEIGYSTLDGDFHASDCGAPHLRKRTFILSKRNWSPVVYASECRECECCGETVCPHCNIHYFECSCVGPTEDEWRMEEEDWGIVAYPDLPGCKKQCGAFSIQEEHLALERHRWWEAEPRVGRVANGVANRVDRLKALGNGQVPAVAATAFRLLSEGLT